MVTTIKSVKISEANQQFSRLIQQMESDRIPVRILRRDKPVAILSPDAGDRKSGKEWKTAFDEMCRLHETGLDLGGIRVDRGDLYDRQ